MVWMRAFHLLWSFASLLALVAVKPVHSLMSSNHCAASLPLLLFPSTIPSTMFFSKHGCLMMCPKYHQLSVSNGCSKCQANQSRVLLKYAGSTITQMSQLTFYWISSVSKIRPRMKLLKRLWLLGDRL